MNYKVHTTAKKINSASEIVSTKNDDPNHFDPRYFGKGKKYHQPEKHVLDNIFNSLRFLRDYAINCEDFEIVNASIESKLDYFRMVNLEDELGVSDLEKVKMFVFFIWFLILVFFFEKSEKTRFFTIFA